MASIRWERYPHPATYASARAWLQMQADLGRAPNTLDAYGRALQDYLSFCADRGIAPDTAQKEHIVAYVHNLASRHRRRAVPSGPEAAQAGLANATMQLYLTAVRLFYDSLVEHDVRSLNPVGRGRYTPGNAFAGQRERGLIPRFHKLPWIPNEDQWRVLLHAVKEECLRNQVMFLVAYEGALRREELVCLESRDIDPPYRKLTIRGDTTKTRRGRVVFYSDYTSHLLGTYLRHRRELSAARGRLFLSESHRNAGQPLCADMWSAIVERIAVRAGVPQFTTHTARHLRLTHLARAGWDIHELATYAGHRTPQTTLLYIHLSGRDLSEKLARTMAHTDRWLAAVLTEGDRG